MDKKVPAFHPQIDIVANLLTAASASLEHLPTEAKVAMEAAIAPFHQFSVAMAWSTFDVLRISSTLSDDEATKALKLFVENYVAPQADWEALRETVANLESTQG